MCVWLFVWLVDGIIIKRLSGVLRENIKSLFKQHTHAHTQTFP